MSKYQEALNRFGSYQEYTNYIKETDEVIDFSKIHNCYKEKPDNKTTRRLIKLYKNKEYTLSKIGKPLYYIEKVETMDKIMFLLGIFFTISFYCMLIILVVDIDAWTNNRGGMLMLFGVYSGVAYMSTKLNIDKPYFFTKEVFKTLIFPFNKFNFDSHEFAKYIIGRKGFYYTKQSYEKLYTYKYFLENKKELENDEFWKFIMSPQNQTT